MTTPTAPAPPGPAIAKTIGAALLTLALVIAFLPVTVLGRDCGSPLDPASSYSAGALCEGARGDRWPWIIGLGIAGLAALVIAGLLAPLPARPAARRAPIER